MRNNIVSQPRTSFITRHLFKPSYCFFRLLLDIKCYALVKFFTIETTHHPIQSTYYQNLVPSKVRTFLSKPRTIQTSYHTIQTAYYNIQNAYYLNLVQSKPSSIISKISTFQTANHMLTRRHILINFASWWRLNFFSKTFTIVTSIINTNWIMNDFFGNHSHAAKLYMYNSDNLVAETRLLCCSSKYVSKF